MVRRPLFNDAKEEENKSKNHTPLLLMAEIPDEEDTQSTCLTGTPTSD